jgi:hypothetical protein
VEETFRSIAAMMLDIISSLEAGVSDHVWSIEELVGVLDRPISN